MPRRIATIARRAGVARTTAVYILKRFEKRGLVEHITEEGIKGWKYKTGLEKMHYKALNGKLETNKTGRI